VDISYVKDSADLNHPNAVSPPINLLYLGWTADGEWTNYAVDVKEPGTYTIKALYSHLVTTVSYDVNGVPAATGTVPRATESWHHWDYGPIGTITFREAGLQVLTFHYGRATTGRSGSSRRWVRRRRIRRETSTRRDSLRPSAIVEGMGSGGVAVAGSRSPPTWSFRRRLRSLRGS
jgi:hypothetical protein